MLAWQTDRQIRVLALMASLSQRQTDGAAKTLPACNSFLAIQNLDSDFISRYYFSQKANQTLGLIMLTHGEERTSLPRHMSNAVFKHSEKAKLESFFPRHQTHQLH